jgi:hypothetical protein
MAGCIVSLSDSPTFTSKVNNKMEKLQSKTFGEKLKYTVMLMPDAPPTASTTDGRKQP